MLKLVSISAYTFLFILFGFTLIFAIKLGTKNFWSLRSFAIFYPAITGLLVTSYYLVKDVFILTDKETTESREFVQIFKDSNRFLDNLEPIMLSSRVMDNNINTKKFRGYINSYHKSYDLIKKNKKINEELAFQVAESVILEGFLSKIKDNWISISGKENPQYSTKINIGDLIDKIKKHNTVFDSKVLSVTLPQNANINYTKIEKSEKYIEHGLLEISSVAFEFELRVSPHGIDNFFPKYNDFDRFTLDLNTSHNDNFQYKKYFINISFKLNKLSNFTEDHELLVKFHDEILKYFDNEFSWSSLKEQLIFHFTNKLYNNEHFETTEDAERRLIIEKLLNIEKSLGK